MFVMGVDGLMMGLAGVDMTQTEKKLWFSESLVRLEKEIAPVKLTPRFEV